MRYNNILLISPVYKKSHFYGGKSVTPPVGLGYLAEALKRKGVTVSVMDMGLGHSLRDLFSMIRERGIDLIGVSMISYRFLPIYAMISRVKREFPAIPIIAGGPHLLSFRKKVLEECPSIDYGVVGQGEEALCDLVAGVDEGAIAGLIHKRDGKIEEGLPGRLIADLNAMPFPKYEEFEMGRYHKIMPLMSSRGCPSQCIYCQKTTGDKIYFRSAEHVLSEIRYWYSRGYRRFSFNDENFTLVNKRTSDICEGIRSEGMHDAEFSAQGVRADCVNEDVLTHMRRAGFVNLSFGVEAGNDRMLKVLKKGLKMEMVDKAVRTALDLSFKVQLYFLIGSPHETLDDVRDSFAFALKHPVYKVIFSNLIPYPETELFRWVEANGRLYQRPEIYLDRICASLNKPTFEAPGMTYAEKVRALRERHIVTRKVFVNGMSRRIVERYRVPHSVAKALARLLSFRAIYNVAMSGSINRCGVFVRKALAGSK